MKTSGLNNTFYENTHFCVFPPANVLALICKWCLLLLCFLISMKKWWASFWHFNTYFDLSILLPHFPPHPLWLTLPNHLLMRWCTYTHHLAFRSLLPSPLIFLNSNGKDTAFHLSHVYLFFWYQPKLKEVCIDTGLAWMLQAFQCFLCRSPAPCAAAYRPTLLTHTQKPRLSLLLFSIFPSWQQPRFTA